MNREKKLNVVYLTLPPLENSAANDATSSTLLDKDITSENEVIFNDDCSIVMSSDNTNVDNHRNSTSRQSIEIEQFTVEIMNENDNEGRTHSPDHQVKPSTESENEEYENEPNIFLPEVELKEGSEENDPVENQFDSASKFLSSFDPSNQEAEACSNDDDEEMEVSTVTGTDTVVNAEASEFTCKYCLKKYTCKNHMYVHIRTFHKINFKDSSEAVSTNQDAATSDGSVACNNVNNQDFLLSEGMEIDELTCKFCLKEFKSKANLNTHIKAVHKIRYKTYERRHVRCVECNVTFQLMGDLREHLQRIHMLNMEPEEIYLPNMNAFKKWKTEIERRDLASFGRKKINTSAENVQKYYYFCHLSGKTEPQLGGKRQRLLRASGACLGSETRCTAGIHVKELANEVYVKYFPHHYGHGQQKPLVRPSNEEQNDAPENESNEVAFETLLDDIHENASKAYHSINLARKKDVWFVKRIFRTEDYIWGLSDAESVERWVRLCSQMDESPILYYNRDEDEFLLIIMTEFQKHLLLSSDKTMVSVESILRCKGLHFYLTYITVVDENDMAFPVAYCISNKLTNYVIRMFFTSIRESTGSLSYTYFASDWRKFYHDEWVEVMNDKSKWLLSLWYIDNRHCHQIGTCFTNEKSTERNNNVNVKRAETYKKFRMMMECQDPDVFETMFADYIEWLQSHPQSKKLGDNFLRNYGAKKEMWANCYQKDLKLNTHISVEVLHRTLRYCSAEGRKTKRLDKFIFGIIKLVRYKMLARLTNMLDTEKMGLVIVAIDTCHRIGMEISTDRISSISNKIWLIKSDEEDEDNDVYITCEFDSCPEVCSLRCSECDICVHMFSCSCMQNLINANLCQHIHAIVFKFLRPHFSPLNSPIRDNSEDIENVQVAPRSRWTPAGEPLLESALKKTHDVYTQIRSNKCTLSQESLTFLIQRLNDCLDICSGENDKGYANKSTDTKSLFPEKKSTSTGGSSSQQSTLPFMPPNTLQSILSQNKPQSRYFLVVKNNTKK